LTGFTIPVITGAANAQAGDIYLSLGAADVQIGQEGYLLTIADTVTISAHTDTGVFYGTRSLLQMLRQGFQIPAGTARDWPDYPERGMMVDTGRKFYSVDFLARHIKELAYLKLNYFHLHLSDQDAYGGYGFRLESVSHPEITSPQHYTAAEMQSLLELAQAYHVMIVPEIDVPSHALPLLAPYPKLQLPGTIGKLDLSNPASYALVQDLLEEFLPQFPAPYWHTGGDEYLGNWEYANYPQLQTYARQLYGPSANGQDVYIGFVNWVDRIVRAHGKQLRAWNDLYGVTGNVNTPNPDIILEMWWQYNSPQFARRALRDHRVDQYIGFFGRPEPPGAATGDDSSGICLSRSPRRRACLEGQILRSGEPPARLGTGIADAARPGAGRELRIFRRDKRAADVRGQL
jgi:hexosaminidase